MLHPGATGLFILACIALGLVPGPAVLYVTAQSMSHGRRAGLACVAGIAVGGLVHAAAAALGLSALILSSATAFSIVKWAGVIYLFVLGLKCLIVPADAASPTGPVRRRLHSLFREGIVVSILNPKTVLFFLAFLPQFIDASKPVARQVMVLGGIFVAVAFIRHAMHAFLAGTAGKFLRSHPGFPRAQRWVSGTVYIGLGIAAAFAGSRKN